MSAWVPRLLLCSPVSAAGGFLDAAAAAAPVPCSWVPKLRNFA